VRGSQSITALLGAAPLAVIPYIPVEGENRTVDRGKMLRISAIVAGAVLLVLVLVNFLYKPLDVLWYIMLRKLGI